MTDSELAEFLSLPHELEGVEFKGPGPRTSPALFAKVARAMLAMTNRSQGGIVIIGVDEGPRHKLKLEGLGDDDLATWNFDDLGASLAAVADPAIRFRVSTPQHEGRNYVGIEVAPFDEIPVICRRRYPATARRGEPLVLREGAIYVRSQRKPESIEIPSQTEMRALLELATERRMAKLLGTVERAGLTIGGREDPQVAFDAQLEQDFR
jgi:predicted HTH transcriptional regulator